MVNSLNCRLLVERDGVPVWKSLERIVLRAPAGGIIVEVPVSRGEMVDNGDLLVLILDPIELRFRGWVPEGEIQSLRPGVPVRIDLPGGIKPVTSTLIGPDETRWRRGHRERCNLEGSELPCAHFPESARVRLQRVPVAAFY